jgi:hypothetical protein
MAGRRRHGGLEYRASSREQSRVTFSPGLVLTFGITVTYSSQAAVASRLVAILARRV